MNIAQIVRLALLIITFGIMCLILLDRKFSMKKTLIIYGGFVTLSIVINALIWFLFGWRTYSILYALVTNGCSTVALFLLSKRKNFSVIFTMLTATVCTNIPATAASYIRLETGCSIWTEILIRTVVSLPIIIILYRYLRPFYLQMLTVMKKGWGYLCLIPGSYYIIVIVNSIDLPLVPEEYRPIFFNFLLALLITVVSYGVIFALFGTIIREAKMRDEGQLLKIQMQAMERHFDILKESDESVRIRHHDLRHYIAEIKVLIESGNTQEALYVLGNVEEQNENSSIPSYCNNPTVNAILAYYIQKAQHEGITVEADCRLPERLSVEPSELAMVLANAIENAINACCKLPEGVERFIRIKTVPFPQLAVEITNSYTGTVEFNENGQPVSTEIGHGLGSKSIAAFAKRHDGIVEYSTDGSLFRLRLLVGA